MPRSKSGVVRKVTVGNLPWSSTPRFVRPSENTCPEGKVKYKLTTSPTLKPRASIKNVVPAGPQFGVTTTFVPEGTPEQSAATGGVTLKYPIALWWESRPSIVVAHMPFWLLLL